jgi:hypothetical protein
MNQLNERLSNLYSLLPRSSTKWDFEKKYRVYLFRKINQIKTPMKTFKVSRERAIIIASNHNNIPLEKAKSYTDSELREVLRHLNLKPGF